MANPRIADTLPISESLSENPRIMYAKWNRSVLQYAVSNSIHDFDLNRLLLSDAEWAIQFPPIDDGFGVFVPQPRLPVFPARLVGNAGATALANWKYDTELASSALAASSRFKEAILLSAGPSIDREFSHPLRGHIDHEIHQIMAFIEGGYGTINEADILRLKNELIIDESKSWRDNVANFRSIFALFAPVGLFTTDLDKRSVLDNAIAKTKFASILESYKGDYPDLLARTFDQMCNYIEIRESSISASAAGFAGKVEAAVAAITAVQKAEIAALTATVAALTANPATATAAAQAPNHAGQGGRGGRGAGRGQGRGAGRGRQQPARYCFVHGYKAHMGTDCTTMAADLSYTLAMKAATAPCTIDGYAGCK